LSTGAGSSATFCRAFGIVDAVHECAGIGRDCLIYVIQVEHGRRSDGHEILALFIHPDGKRWVTWTPQGDYDASAGADNFIG